MHQHSGTRHDCWRINTDVVASPSNTYVLDYRKYIPFSYLAAFPENETEAFPFVPIEITLQIINALSGIHELLGFGNTAQPTGVTRERATDCALLVMASTRPQQANAALCSRPARLRSHSKEVTFPSGLKSQQAFHSIINKQKDSRLPDGIMEIIDGVSRRCSRRCSIVNVLIYYRPFR